MNKKAVGGVLAIAIAVAYGGSTWWAGSKVESTFATAFAELPKQTALVRVIDRQYDRGFFGAVSTLTLEIGCAAGDASTTASPPPAGKPAEGGEQEEEAQADTEDGGAVSPGSILPKPFRITFRDTIRHGPLAGGTLAAASIDSELVLDAKAQAEAEKLFGQARPFMAHTKVGFDGGFASDITIAPAKRTEEGKRQFTWQGAQAHVEMNGTRTQARYDITAPGLDFGDTAKGLQLKMGKLTAKADFHASAGWLMPTGKSEGHLDAFELSVAKGAGANAEANAEASADTPANAPKPLKVLLQNIGLSDELSLKDGLYTYDGTVKGDGKIGETRVDSFEVRSGARRIQAAGYKKLADAWMQSSAAAGCGIKSAKASQAAMKALADQLAPELKAMAKYSPEFGLDKLAFEIGGKRGEISYTAGMVGVTDEDLKAPGMALLMKRGVLKANARLPVQWLEEIAAANAGSGQTPPPEMVAGLIEQGQAKGLVEREGDDVKARIEFSAGSLKVNGKPLLPGAPRG